MSDRERSVKPAKKELPPKKECRNCGEPYFRSRNGTNKKTKCPECGKSGCTICVSMTETGTCCCAPEES
jgi:hypothetical protein